VIDKDSCHCEECRVLPLGIGHWSDCAVHQEPCEPNGECNCVLYIDSLTPQDNQDRIKRITNNIL